MITRGVGLWLQHREVESSFPSAIKVLKKLFTFSIMMETWLILSLQGQMDIGGLFIRLNASFLSNWNPVPQF